MSNNNVKNVKKVDDMLKKAINNQTELKEKIVILKDIMNEIILKERFLKALLTVRYGNVDYVLKLVNDIKINFNDDGINKLIGHAKDGIDRIRRVTKRLENKNFKERNVQVEAAEQGASEVSATVMRVNDMIANIKEKTAILDEKSLKLVKDIGEVTAASNLHYINSAATGYYSDELYDAYEAAYKNMKKRISNEEKEERQRMKNARLAEIKANAEAADRILEAKIKALMPHYPGKSREELIEILERLEGMVRNFSRPPRGTQYYGNNPNGANGTRGLWGGALPKRKRKTRKNK